jgi:hypothetical protein
MAQLRLTAVVSAALIAAACPVAAADPTPMVRPPDGWHLDAERAAQVLAAGGHGDGVTAVEAYVPGTPDAGVALFVTRSSAGSGAAVALANEFRATVDRDKLTSKTAVLDKIVDKIVDGDDASWKTIELTSHDPAIHLSRQARMIVGSVANGVVAVTGECLIRDDAARPLVDACVAALQTLDRGSGDAAPPLTAPTAATSGPQPRAPATMRDAPGPVMTPIEVPPPEQTVDRRPIYFGVGLVVLALLFWWNRRRRDAAHAGDDDADAEALRSAARKDDDK